MTLLCTLLGAVLFSLMVSSEILPQADFDVQAVGGKWYITGVASNSEWFVKRKTSMKTGTYIITPTANGDLKMVFSTLTSNGTCRRMENLANKTEVPGKFVYLSRRTGHLSDLRMVDVKYDEYGLAHAVNTNGNESYVVNKLYGRNADVSAEVQEKFRQFSVQTGILPENIVILPKNDECPPE